MISPSGSRTDTKSRRLWTRRALWLAVALWFAHYAYVRITTPPGEAWSNRPEADPTMASMIQLLEVAAVLPPCANPRIGDGTESEYVWPEDPCLAGLLVRWEPDRNDLQSAAIAYLSDAGNGRILDKIVEYCCANRIQLLNCNIRSFHNKYNYDNAKHDVCDFDNAVCALTFRARWRSAEHDDAAGALDDLRCTLLLSRFHAQYWIRANSFMAPCLVRFVQFELGCLARECALKPAQVRVVLDELDETHPLSLEQALLGDGTDDAEIEDLLNQYYTLDEHGDGWVVFSERWMWNALEWQAVNGDNRFCNVFSPLFHSRRTMKERIKASQEMWRGVDALDLGGVLELLKRRDNSALSATILDGPLYAITEKYKHYEVLSQCALTAQQRALKIMLTLSAYRYEHQEYPETLDALVPEYLDAVPLELISHQPFLYRRIGADDYELDQAASIWDPIHRWPRDHYSGKSFIPRRIAVSADTPQASDEHP